MRRFATSAIFAASGKRIRALPIRNQLATDSMEIHMKLLAAILASLSVLALAPAQADPARLATTCAQSRPRSRNTASGVVLGDVWKRPGLSPRDRSIVTLAALIARNQTAEMAYYVDLALDNGVKPAKSPRSSRISPSTRAGAMR